MDYCSLDDAFPAVGPTPPGCRGADSGAAARKAERRKAKRCKVPAMQLLDQPFDEAAETPDNPPQSVDPDRPQLGQKTDTPPAFNHGSGMNGVTEGMQPVIEPVQYNQPTTMKKTPAWFGTKVGGEEGFTPYVGTQGGSDADVANSDEYLLKPSFEDAYKARALDKPSGGPVLPLPNLNDNWKPLSMGPAGAQTAYYERYATQGSRPAAAPTGPATADMSEIKKKLDKIFSRLDDIERNRVCTDNSNTEVGMFVMTGVFVLFFMDILVRKTTNMRVYPM
jgi:hypothetical protein